MKAIFTFTSAFYALLLHFVFIMYPICETNAQDIQFSQYYQAPMYLNPAFAGSAHHHRIISHNRLQWPNLDAKYTSFLLSYDTYFNHYKSGFGLMAAHDRQGPNSVSSTEIQAQYSYELHFHEHYTFRFGLQGGYVRRHIDAADRTFPSQYNNDGQIDGLGNGEALTNLNKHLLDVGAGGVFYSKHLWLGFAAHHINTPNQSYTGQSSRYPAKFSIMGGYKILLNNVHHAFFEETKDISLTPTFLYKAQGKADQIDIGMYLNYDQLILGAWYRGIPFKKYASNLQNNESVVAQLGWHFEHFSVCYSYDFVVSKLTQANPRGAHELNLTYIFFKDHKGAKPMKKLPCPNFYKHFKLE
jgi:type IX secretion system PorP/SprF family membrane protein